MARPKKAVVEIDSLEACEIAMTDLLLAVTDVEALQAEQALAVAEASARFESHLNDAKKRRDDLTLGLRNYYYAHLSECEKDGKQCKLANGVMGRRDNPPALKPLSRNWSWEAIAIQVRELWPGKYFHPPKPPALDKDALKAGLSAEELAKAGMKTEAEETFYAEPMRPPKEGA